MKNKEQNLKEFMIQQNKILKDWFIRNYGKRCKTYCKDCVVCESWRCFDKLKYNEEDLK